MRAVAARRCAMLARSSDTEGTPKHIKLIRFVRQHPDLSIAAIARELGRDDKRMHGDVRVLKAAGLLEQNETGFKAPYAKVEAELSFA